MKRYGSILLTFAVLFTLCAGALPIYASDSASITLTPYRSILMVGQSASLSISVTPSNMPIDIEITDDDEFYDVLEYNETYKTLKGLRKGTATITATGIHPDTNETVTTSITVKVRASTGLVDGCNYYIMNYGSGMDLSLSSSSDTNNVRISGRNPSTMSESQWKIVSNADGTTRLQNVFSSTGRSAYVSGTNLVLYNSTSSRTKLNIYRMESGFYSGKYVIEYNNQYLAMNSSGDVYFTNNSSIWTYWTFLAVDKGVADITSHDYTYTNDEDESCHFYTAINNEKFVELFEDLGYTSYFTTNFQASDAYLYLCTEDDIFVFSGHGNAGLISFNTTGDVSTGTIAVNSSVASQYIVGTDRQYIDSCEENGLAALRCALYLGCNTGVDITVNRKTYNLVDATFDKGAHFVLGTTKTLYTNQTNDWLGYFLDSIELGNNIETAIEDANEALDTIEVPYTKSDGNEATEPVYGLPTYTAGDSNQYLE